MHQLSRWPAYSILKASFFVRCMMFLKMYNKSHNMKALLKYFYKKTLPQLQENSFVMRHFYKLILAHIMKRGESDVERQISIQGIHLSAFWNYILKREVSYKTVLCHHNYWCFPIMLPLIHIEGECVVSDVITSSQRKWSQTITAWHLSKDNCKMFPWPDTFKYVSDPCFLNNWTALRHTDHDWHLKAIRTSSQHDRLFIHLKQFNYSRSMDHSHT